MLSGRLRTRPRIAMCSTFKGRLPHLRETLPKNIADNADYENCVFIVLDYGCQDHLLEYLSAFHSKDLESGKLVYYGFPSAAVFEMAKAKNMSQRCGMLEGADILVNLDADAFTGPGFATYLARGFTATDEKVFMPAMWNRWIVRDGTREWVSENRDGTFGLPVPKGCAGRIATTVDAFLLAGGYDERFNKWGPDDRDYNVRLRQLGFKPLLIHREYLETIRHNDKLRFREYPEAADYCGQCSLVPIEECPPPIVNFGHCGCGTVYRNSDPIPLTLEPLPTRIFGIGMHKTATTSLHMAMKVLGLNSAHWPSAHWAKAVWREMNNTGKSPTLEKHYAASDLPIPLLYRKLDKAYPGSKFILTVLDDEVWVKAAEKHWDSRRNPNRARWDSDPFTHRIHEVLYGQRHFDRDVFLARYRHHNSDVLKYFKDRPDDLLVMRMNEGSGWAELCEFLGVENPGVPYPQGNRGGRGLTA